MSKEVQLAGGPSDSESEYVGGSRELRVDTSNGFLRLHDGVTPGGTIIPNLDSLIASFQARSAELDGLTFPAAGKGFVVRTAAGVYALRKFVYSTDDFAVVNPTGVGGDVQVNLAAIIASAHIWTGANVFQGEVAFQAGATGNLTGNVTGNLTGNAAGDHTGSFTGDVDVRGHGVGFDDGQIPAAAINGLAALIKSTAFRVGDFKLWGGALTDIEDGWHLCDGTHGTPNLSGIFIMGAGDGHAPGQTGGAASHTHTGVTDSQGAHTHAQAGVTGNSVTGVGVTKNTYNVQIGGSTNYINVVQDYFETDTGHTHSIGGNTGSSGTHTHTVTNDATDSRPPFYAMAIIMKVS